MEFIPNFFNNPEMFTLFLLRHTNVLIDCQTHNENLQEIKLIFPTGNRVSFFSDGHQCAYNADTNTIIYC